MNYIIYGNSYNLIDDEVAKITQNKPFITYSLEDVSIKNILEDMCYNSMFDEEKIVVVKDTESLFSAKKESEEISELKKYLTNPNDFATMILVSKEKVREKGYLKDLISKLKVIDTPIVTKQFELAKILGDLIKKNGYGISQNTLNNFSTKCALNYDIALNEFNKLKAIKNNDKLITDEDVENYISNYNLNDIFGLKDAIINRDIKKANTMISDLESSKMEVIPLVVMLEKEFCTVYNIQLLVKQGLNNDEISEKLNGMHPYRVKLLRDAGKKFSSQELEHIIKYLCDLDLKLVSCDNLGFDELRKFLLEL